MSASDDQSQDQGGRKELGVLSIRFYIQSSFSVSCKASNCQVDLAVRVSIAGSWIQCFSNH
jgi:hypothetical protein